MSRGMPPAWRLDGRADVVKTLVDNELMQRLLELVDAVEDQAFFGGK